MNPNAYARSGVDIDRGERFVEFIKQIRSEAVSKSIGGFSGSFEIEPGRFRHPVFMTTTDGVGTKILVARRMRRFDTIGVDLVAMCVNDLIVCGAEPMTFLDYIACGRIEDELLHRIMTGIVAGCEQAGCTLGGGETAELPDMYREGEFDLAGFAVGVAERDQVLPKLDRMREGDAIMALPSVGIHANGLSLARKAIPTEETALWQELLRPTKIYTRELRPLLDSQLILAAAHITGGGLAANVQRVIPRALEPRFDYQWRVPKIFSEIKRCGGVEDAEMRRVFNMGVGIAFMVSAENRDSLLTIAAKEGIEVEVIGELVHG